MSFWDNNYKILKRQYGGLYEELSYDNDSNNNNFPNEIEIVDTPAGDPTLRINGIFVHSPRDPAREGQRLAQAIDSGESPVVILGFGLGYTAQYAAALGRPVIIVEKHKYMLRKAFELRDLTEFLSAKNIIFVVGGSGDGVVNALNIINDLNKNDERPAPAIIRNRALMDLDNEWYKNAEDKIRTWIMKDKVNTATLKRFGKRWVRNISQNMIAIRNYPGVSRLKNLNTFPVFLAAAGPSLDKIKPFIKEIYERCIVIAVDTNLRFFINNGIQPDFVLTVDPQFWNSRHLDRCVCEKTALIAESAVFPPVLRLPFTRKFLCSSLFPLGTYIEQQVDSKGRLGAGGSVATTAWDFARSLGGNNIWIAGLDLAFPEYKTHFRGARFEEKANSESTRFRPVETWVVRALRDGIPFKAKSAGGGQVLTDRRLSLYAAWFENQFRNNPQVHNYSLFQEGLAIPGLQAKSAEEFIKLPVCRKEIDTCLQECYAQIDTEFNNTEETAKRTASYEKALASLIGGLNSIKKAAENGKAICKKTNHTEQDNKELEKITRQIADSEVKEIASFLIPMELGKEDEAASYLQSSLNLFNSLSESAGFYLELL
ncbi:MAG: DUF115 domain-containing protein [Treponema sp.]|jgi:hypothetical protein|nr:DUF115 domain-containing protein [Treponema sp.]